MHYIQHFAQCTTLGRTFRYLHEFNLENFYYTHVRYVLTDRRFSLSLHPRLGPSLPPQNGTRTGPDPGYCT